MRAGIGHIVRRCKLLVDPGTCRTCVGAGTHVKRISTIGTDPIARCARPITPAIGSSRSAGCVTDSPDPIADDRGGLDRSPDCYRLVLALKFHFPVGRWGGPSGEIARQG